MDLSKITSVIRAHLSQAKGVASLQLQNHIYGCFLIMEDIAQKTVSFSENHLIGLRYRFNMEKQFSQIGIRYGFVMDRMAILEPVPVDYQEVWMDLFRDIHLTQDIELVDRIEDALNEVIQEVVPVEEAFFIQASVSGALPQEWVIKVFSLLHPSLVVEEKVEEGAPTKESQLPKAKAETAMHPSSTHRRFSRTRRQVSSDRINPTFLVKRGFARTRRNAPCV